MKNKQHIVFGLHAVKVLLEKKRKITRLLIERNRDDQKIQVILSLAKSQAILVSRVSQEELRELSQDKNHQGVLAVCEETESYHENDLLSLLNNIEKPWFILILDGIQDPHNLGACLRSADAAGVNMVIAPKDKAVGITPVVAKVASGATETVRFIQVTNLARTLTLLKEAGVWIYGADANAKTFYFKENFTNNIALVLGAEGTGLRRLTREHCDGLLAIPMQGEISSLNVSVAAGILMFEVVRQRCLE